MTPTENSAIAALRADVQALNKSVNDMAVNMAALTSRIEHPSPLDCVQATELATLKKNDVEIYKRLNALEQWRAWVIGAVAAVGVLVGIFAQRILAAIWPGQGK